MVLPVRAVALLLSLAALAGAASETAAAQTQGASGRLERARAAAGAAPQLGRDVRPDADGLVLEGALDPDAYVVGPGDEFAVSIGGSVPRQVRAVVGADGRLLVPEAGSFDAAGRTLARVQNEVRAALRGQFRNVGTDVSLVSPRRFYVHVSGAVPEPGRRAVRAIARVGDAVEQAAGESLLGLADYGFSGGDRRARARALRNVRVTHADGRSETVDLLRYLRTGDLGANPYLSDGDAVYLPQFDPTLEGVAVSGAVDRPGAYDVRPGDTAADLLAVTVGPEAASRVARVRRTRRGPSGAVEAVEVAVGQAETLDIRPRDGLSAVADDPLASTAEVVGAVVYPGVYPVTIGTTSLADLVEMAGGLRPDALARAAYLSRPSRSGLDRTEPAGGAASGASEEIPSDIAVADDLLNNLFSRRFYYRETTSTPRVSLDAERAISGAVEVPLREGDRLVVPFDRGTVRVYGRVVRPGYLPFEPGRSAADYIQAAGGAGATAAAVYVVDAASGQFREGGDAAVQPGDAVFVNSLASPDTPELAQLALQERQSEREDRRDRRQATFQTFQTVLAAVSTVATVIVLYLSATDGN